MTIRRTPAGIAAAVALGVSGTTLAGFAQPLDAAREAIIGSEVNEVEVEGAAETERVVAAIEKTRQSITAVRKAANLDKVDIVFLSDAAAAKGGPPPEIAAKVEERMEEIAELRQEFEGNAMLYHAIDSRRVLVRDVLAVEFHDAGVVIYAAARPSGN